MREPVTKRHPMIDMEEFERRLLIDMEEFERRLRQSSGNQTDGDPLAELARVISGQKEPVQGVAEPQSQSSTEAWQVATPSPEAQETEEEPDALQSLDDDKMACQDSGTVKEKIGSRRSLYIMIMAAIIVVGMVGVGASVGYRSGGASPPPEIATISENGPTKPQLEKTNRSDVPTTDASILGAAPQPSPVTAVNNVAQPLAPQPRETMPASEIAASPEQLETQVEPSRQTAPVEPEKMNTASVERQDALISSDMPPQVSSDMPPQAIAKIVPLPVPRPAALAKPSTPKTAKPKGPASTVTTHPMQATDSRGGGPEPDPWEIYYAVYLATLPSRRHLC
jgi:hypothetical protein